MTPSILPPVTPRPTVVVPPPRPLDELRAEAAARLAAPLLPAEALRASWRAEEGR